MHKHHKPQEQSTKVMQHILDEMKTVQDKIYRDMVRLVEIKVETENTLKRIQRE